MKDQQLFGVHPVMPQAVGYLPPETPVPGAWVGEIVSSVLLPAAETAAWVTVLYFLLR